MAEVLSRLNGGEFIGLVAVVMGCLTGIAGIVGGVWHSVRTTEAEVALKRDLMASGMAAEDIERVVNATSGGSTATELAKARAHAQVEIVKARGF